MAPDSFGPAGRLDGLAGIIGFACRVAGASHPQELWQALDELQDLRSEIPQERFNINAFYHPIRAMKGRTNVRHGYFLNQPIDVFDADFFNISRKEAEAMDPQQRLILEVVYEALENAGLDLATFSGTDTSVYCGSSTTDYSEVSASDLADYPMYSNTGTGPCMMANRVSHFYNLKGPSVYLNTACSSSLVCLHMASEAIKSGHCQMAVVIGSALHLEPRPFSTMADFGMLSADGRSKAFDESGQGFARGEGVCAVILKRVQSAIEDRNNIHAVVRGSFSNHDGASANLTVPSSEAQIALIQNTYDRAGIKTESTDLVEAHGAGTPVGDPKEAEALAAVFGSDGRQTPIYVGSVKSVLGHLEGAAGLIGTIKAVMCVQRGAILGNKHFRSVRQGIKTGSGGICVPTETIAWPIRNGPRRASVNSFGYGGSNCHCIIEQFIPTHYTSDTVEIHLPCDVPYLLPLSCHSKRSGSLFSQRLLQYLMKYTGVTIPQLAVTLSTGRSLHLERAYIIASSRDTFMKSLKDLTTEERWKTTDKAVSRLGFLFTGQGAQWALMGAALLPIKMFRNALDECQDALSALPTCSTPWNIHDELLRDRRSTKLHLAEFAQPICTAVQIGLVHVLRSWGVVPSAVVGHSSGEIAAAYAAGFLSLRNAMMIAHYRGLICSQSFLSPQYAPEGMMIAVALSSEVVKELIAPYKGRIEIAAVNSPSTTTLSGDAAALKELSLELSAQGVFHRKLAVEKAYHSYHMRPLSRPYMCMLSSCYCPQDGGVKIPMFSSLTGKQIRGNALQPQYWVDNLTHSVCYQDAVVSMINHPTGAPQVDALIEIGPHPTLKGPTSETMKHIGLRLPYLSTLYRNMNDLTAILDTAGQLYVLGYPTQLDQVLCVNADSSLSPKSKLPTRLGDFPNYAWDQDRYWYQSRLTSASFHRPYQHHLLGAPCGISTTFCSSWRNFLRLRDVPWLADHRIQDSVVFPATGFIGVAIDAVIRACGLSQGYDGLVIENVEILKPLMIPDTERGIETVFQLVRASSNLKSHAQSFKFAFSSFPSSNEKDQEHCTGCIRVTTKGDAHKIFERDTIEVAMDAPFHGYSISSNNLYTHFARVGIQYGREFRLLDGNIGYSPGSASAFVRFETLPFFGTEQENSLAHPAFLDAVLHPLLATTAEENGRLGSDIAVPSSFPSIYFSKEFVTELRKTPTSLLSVSARSRNVEEMSFDADVAVQTQEGIPLILISGMTLRKLPSSKVSHTSSNVLCGLRWQPAFSYLREAPSIARRSLFGAVDLFCHQFPRARILVVSDQPEKDLLKLLEHTGTIEPRHRRFSTITIEGHFEKIQLNDALKSFVDTETPQAQLYDLAVVTANSLEQRLPTNLMTSRYILTNLNLLGISSDYSTYLQCLWATTDYWCLAQRGNLKPASSRNRSVCLVHSIGQKLLLHAVEGCLKDTYDSFENLEFSAITSETAIHSHDIIVLSPLHQNLLWSDSWNGSRESSRKCQQQEFLIMKRLVLLEKKRLILLQRGNPTKDNYPAQALVTGLLRTARNENPSLQITSVDVALEGNLLERLSQWLPTIASSTYHEDELTLKETVQIPRVVPIFKTQGTPQRVSFQRRQCVLLVGGFSGLGIVVARFLVCRGLRHLAFLSRSGPSTNDSKALVEDLRRIEIKLDIFTGDVTNAESVQACIKRVQGSLCGVIHMAMVLRDSSLSTMSFEMWYDSIAPKAHGARLLGQATAHLKLDFFICFSSTSSIVGTRGQANYSAANCYLDAYMLERRYEGFPGTTLNIGMVADAGIIAKTESLQRKMRLLGFTPLSTYDVLDHLENGIATGKSLLIVDDDGLELHRSISGAVSNSARFFAAQRSIMQCITSIAENNAENDDADRESEAQQTKIAEISDDTSRARAISVFLKGTLCKLTDVPLENFDSSRSMLSYGIDSITAQDIKQEVRRATGAEISVFDTLGSLTVRDVGNKINDIVAHNGRSKGPPRERNLLSIKPVKRAN